MTEVEAYEAVCQRWKAVWETAQPSVPYVFENRKMPEPTPRGPWARVTMRQTDSSQHTLGAPGARQWLREANVWVQLFRPVGEGMAAIRALVDSTRAVFEGVAYDGVSPMGAGRMVTTGSNPDGSQKFSPNDGHWMEVVMIFPVQYYETR